MRCSPLAVFNFLTPKDGGVRRLARGLAYGPSARQKLDIYAPRTATSVLPVIFFIYGGSWQEGDRGNYEFAGRALAALGYIVVIADYRLVPEIEYPGFVRDGALALNYVTDNIARFGGDPERIGLVGHSAGAYNAMMLALDAQYGFAQHANCPIKAAVGLSGPYDFYPFDGPISLRVFGAVPAPTQTQPIAHVHSNAPPILLISGEKDQLVLPRNSVALAAALRDVHVSADEQYFASLGHAGTLLALAWPLRWRAPILAGIGQFLASKLAADPA